MRFKIRPKKLIVPAVNFLSVAGIIATTVIGALAAQSQQYNYSAQRWKGESKEDFSQASCYFSEDADFDTSRLRSVKGQFLSSMRDAACDTDNKDNLVVDAYSSVVGDYVVKCDMTGKTNAQITAVGGDFFFFHDFGLLSGSYFTPKDTMQDGAVIDRSLAWALYGSYDIAGMNIYINGVKCYIAGVVKDPETKTEQTCAGKVPKAYITYDTASTMMKYSSNVDPTMSTDSYKKITSYECILPEPVEKFAINTVKKVFKDTYNDKVSIVDNDRRFSVSKRTKAFSKLSESVIRNDGIRLPYWENASRMYEYRASVCYGIRKYLFIIPVITLLWLAYKGIRAYNNNKRHLKKKIADFIEKTLRKIKPKKKGLTS